MVIGLVDPGFLPNLRYSCCNNKYLPYESNKIEIYNKNRYGRQRSWS
jgi:hypothetical protein